MTRTSLLFACCLVALAFWPGVASAQTVPVPNPSFEQGTDRPAGWTLAGGRGAPADWTGGGAGKWLDGDAADGRRSLAVVGTGRDDGTWLSQPVSLEPAGVYCLRFRARGLGASSGTAVTGPTYCNRDLGVPPERWTEYQSYFVAPSEPRPGETQLRFGQWRVKGTVAFDDVRLVRAVPMYASEGDLLLGEGESIRPASGAVGSEYQFAAPFRGRSANHSRPLARHRCHFHTNRWWLHEGSEVVYRHDLSGRDQTAARVEVGVCWHAGGELLVEAGTDGSQWRALGTLGAVGSRTFDVPAALLPARCVWVRLSARPAGGKAPSLQVDHYAFTAQVNVKPVSLLGATHFLALPEVAPSLAIEGGTLGEALPGGRNVAQLWLTNRGRQAVSGRLVSVSTAPDGKAARAERPLDLRPGRQRIDAAYQLAGAGENRLRFVLEAGAGFTAEAVVDVPALHDASYGQVLPGSSDAVALWWCSSGWKVSRTRPAPQARGQAIEIRAARNEAEAAQFVLRPAAELRGLQAIATDLKGPGGVVIPAGSVEVLRVRYVHVSRPTDGTGAVGDWPDPLPPLAGPLDIPAGRNQPLWVRVKPPKGIPGGAYAGLLRLAAEGYEAAVPLKVEVYDFDLPDRMTCTTAFGFSPANVWRYQKVRDPAQRRAVLEKYLANLSAHHISPYDPAPLDPFGVTWLGAGDWEGGQRDRTDPHAGEASLKLADTSTTASASATYRKLVAIPPEGLRLRFWYRAEKGHPLLVTLNHHDAAGKWMSGKNNDMRVSGTGEWAQFDRIVRGFPEGAKSVRLTLWPCLYSEEGKTTGTVWYDGLSLTDAATGKPLVAGGDFEPIPPADLRPQFDFAAWDRAMTRAIDYYHFNSFRIGIQGMGGGTFHARYEPSLLGYGEDTPEYKAAFGSYCRQLQEHLREKGWLNEAFVYWFDEPDPKDYAFVNNGFAKLKAAAPDLRRMLTEQVEEALVGGPNIWCPVTPGYDPARAEQRRKHGETFWWYVCTGPKAPYCTLFIDHPATELRVWLWQTWQRKIAGILVWQTNYWTSSAAYPDPARPQDPYEDPMGWTSGYSTPGGARRPWGNGDGRFIYPPEAAATGRQERAVLGGPVDSIRWEMLRDGIEDYEYLAVLKRRLDAAGAALAAERRATYAALLEVPAAVTGDMTVFTADPAPIERRRDEVARAIEALTR